MQTVGMGAEDKSVTNGGNNAKEIKELKKTLKELIAENESLHIRIGELEAALEPEKESTKK